MANPRRSHRSGTFEIEALVRVDLEKLTITYRHAAAYQPQVLTLNAARTPAAEQMLQAMADSVKVGSNGDGDSGWESSQTLESNAPHARVMLAAFGRAGFDDFTDPRIGVAILRKLYAPLTSNEKRSACWLLARVVRDNHPNGIAVSQALKNTRFQTASSTPRVYDDEVADAIESAARGVFTDRYTEQRELFQRLDYDVSGRGWLEVPAAALVDRATRAHPGVVAKDAPQPSFVASYEEQVSWALTHPERFGYAKRGGLRGLGILGPEMKAIGLALYPDNVLVVAASILHCLGENSGFNHSVLLQTDAHNLEYLGSDHALEHNVKARNKSSDTRPTRLNSIYTPGGVIETMAGLTRFTRHARRGLVHLDGTKPAVVDRLFVEHCPDPAASEVITRMRHYNAWRGKRAFDQHWSEAKGGRRDGVQLWMSALRLVAQRRAMSEGLRADVHGHNEQTKMHYSAHVLPDHIFNAHATAAQDAFHDEHVARFTVIADATNGPAKELAAIDPQDIMDVEIGLCTSGGAAPDGPPRRCDLGMVACFTCPNGYRTVDHVPGLLAAVELGDIVERNDPEEWENGQASELRFYAQACLDQFPPVVVGNIKRATDLVPHILIVTGMYMEMRNG